MGLSSKLTAIFLHILKAQLTAVIVFREGLFTTLKIPAASLMLSMASMKESTPVLIHVPAELLKLILEEVK